MNDKEQAKAAEAELRKLLGEASLADAVPHLNVLVRYNGELRRANSAMKTRIEGLEASYQSLKQRCDELERKATQPTTTPKPQPSYEQLDRAKQEKKRSQKLRQQCGDIHLSDDFVLPLPSVHYVEEDGPDDKWTDADVRGVLANPCYAGVGPYPAVTSERVWVAANAKMIGELGAVQYLVNLLYLLRRTFGTHEEFADTPDDPGIVPHPGFLNKFLRLFGR